MSKSSIICPEGHKRFYNEFQDIYYCNPPCEFNKKYDYLVPDSLPVCYCPDGFVVENLSDGWVCSDGSSEEKRIIVVTDKEEYADLNEVKVSIENTLNRPIWIENICNFPLRLRKYNGTDWTLIDLFPEEACPLSFEEIKSNEIKEVTNLVAAVNNLGSSFFTAGRYRFELPYVRTDPELSGQVIPSYYFKSLSNEFSLNNCSTNSDCSFKKNLWRSPSLYGFCLEGSCVQSCDSENYVVGCK